MYWQPQPLRKIRHKQQVTPHTQFQLAQNRRCTNLPGQNTPYAGTPLKGDYATLTRSWLSSKHPKSLERFLRCDTLISNHQRVLLRIPPLFSGNAERCVARTEIRLKYRRTRPLGEKWNCPNDSPYEKAEEVDFSFVGTGQPNRVYSYSCTLTAKQPPASLNAVQKKCSSRMVRYQFDGFKIEEWTLPRGDVKVEVSHSAKNTRAEVAKFAEFVSKLRDRGVKPSDQSKTELGSRCP